MGVQYIGPFIGRSDLVIDGYRVPFVDARELDGGQISFVLDGRLGYMFPVGIADEVARFVADAIAVTAGIGAHPRKDYDDDLMRAQIARSPLHPSLLPHRVHEITAVEAGPDDDASPPDPTI